MLPFTLALLLAACGGSKPDDSTAPGACDTTSPETLAGCVDPTRYEALLTTTAVPRVPGSEGWEMVQDLCASSLEAAGFTVERQAYATGLNVVGTRAGRTAGPPVVISAHYDSVADCPGADDNASGVAGALEAARVLGQGAYDLPLVVACWDQEELGLLGSDAYAEALAGAGGSVTAAFVLEMIGYKSTEEGSQTLPSGLDLLFPDEVEAIAADGYRGDFIAVVADEHAGASAEAMAAFGGSVDLEVVALVLTDEQAASPFLGDLRRSDHASFWARGWPGLMITDTSNFRNTAYHCYEGTDSVDRLDTAFATATVQSMVAAAAKLAGLGGAR